MAGLVALVDEWVIDKRVRSRRGLSDNTETAYRQDLALLARRIADAENRPVPELDPADPSGSTNQQLARIDTADLREANLVAVMSWLVAEGYAPSTRARMLASWRGLCRWLVRAGHLDVDPTVGFETPSGGEQLPVAFTSEQLERILTAAADPRRGLRAAWAARDVAMVGVLAGCGIRASELAALRVGDVHRADPLRITVTGKGNKQRVVPLSAEVLEAVDAYLDDRRGRGLDDAPAESELFVRVNGSRFNTQALDHLVDVWLAGAGVAAPPGERVHAFRHTYAVAQLDHGTTIAELQALLGHANIATTSQYLRVAADGLHHTSRANPINAMLRHHLPHHRARHPE